MTGSINPSNFNQQLFWSLDGLKQAWDRLTFSNASRKLTNAESKPASEMTFSVPDVFDDYAVEGEEPADLALLDLIPPDLALLNLPCAAVNASETTAPTPSEMDELESLIPIELADFSLQHQQAA